MDLTYLYICMVLAYMTESAQLGSSPSFESTSYISLSHYEKLVNWKHPCNQQLHVSTRMETNTTKYQTLRAPETYGVKRITTHKQVFHIQRYSHSASSRFQHAMLIINKDCNWIVY